MGLPLGNRGYVYRKSRASSFAEFKKIHGEGVPAYLISYDHTKAASYCYLASRGADIGDLDSLYLKAFFSTSIGETGIKDDSALLIYLKLAFLYGNPEALFDLGYFFGTGRGLRKSIPSSQDLFRQSGARGFLPSWFEMGLISFYGLCGKSDMVHARDYFVRALPIGECDTTAYIAFIDIMLDAKKKEIPDGAVEELVNAANTGSGFACLVLAIISEHNCRCLPPGTKLRHIIRKSCEFRAKYQCYSKRVKREFEIAFELPEKEGPHCSPRETTCQDLFTDSWKVIGPQDKADQVMVFNDSDDEDDE